MTEPKGPFETLTSAEKRVAIAKDVLAQLALEKIVPHRGTYLEIVLEDDKEFSPDAQLGEFVTSNKVDCTACAVGSLLISTARLADKLQLNSLTDEQLIDSDITLCMGRAECYEYLETFFDSDQLQAMEDMFENTYNDPTGVLAEIMSNVVEHKGTFVPPPSYADDEEDEYDSDDYPDDDAPQEEEKAEEPPHE